MKEWIFEGEYGQDKQWDNYKIDIQEMILGYQKWKYLREGSFGVLGYKGQILCRNILILVFS